MKRWKARMTKQSRIPAWGKAVVLAAVIALVAACATSPTGRTQLKLFSSQEIAQMGQQSFRQMREQLPSIDESELYEYVNCVAEPMLQEVGGDWQVVLFDQDQVNAFALPGNNIGIYRGLLRVAENQHQLATVVGHEIGHVLADHGNERVSTAFATQAGLELGSAIAGGTPTGNHVMAALGLGAEVGIMLPFSRAQETEADIIGLRLMADAGFDPQESVKLWENMEKAAGGSRPPDFLSTHPGPQARMRTLGQNMEDAVSRQRRAHEAGKRPDCFLSDSARAQLQE